MKGTMGQSCYIWIEKAKSPILIAKFTPELRPTVSLSSSSVHTSYYPLSLSLQLQEMMEMEEAETIDLYELQYSDLSSPSTSSIVDSIMEALGPTGPGLLAVTNVPNASNLRSHLLPLARNLALLDRESRKLVLKVILNLNPKLFSFWFISAHNPNLGFRFKINSVL